MTKANTEALKAVANMAPQDNRMHHTPGPWHIGDRQVYTKNHLDGYDKQVCVLHHNGTNDMRKGDARLIAAAPELLAALQSVLKDFDRAFSDLTDENHGDLDQFKSVVKARAAITKAKGE